MSASRMPALRPLAWKRQRQVHRHGGLADATLAGGDRDHVPDAGDLEGLPPRAGRCARRRPGRRPGEPGAHAAASAGTGLAHPGALGHLAGGAGPRCRAALNGRSARPLRGEHGQHVGDALHLAHHLVGRPPQPVQLRGPLRRHGDGERHPPVLDEHLRDEPQVDDIALQIRAFDLAQPVENCLCGQAHDIGSVGVSVRDLAHAAGGSESELQLGWRRRSHVARHIGRRGGRCHGRASGAVRRAAAPELPDHGLRRFGDGRLVRQLEHGNRVLA